MQRWPDCETIVRALSEHGMVVVVQAAAEPQSRPMMVAVLRMVLR